MSSPTPPSDEPCGVCGTQRGEAHEGMNHEFSVEGVLTPKKKTPPALRRPPVPGDSVILRLITCLASKGILTEEDLGHIFPPTVVVNVDPH